MSADENLNLITSDPPLKSFDAVLIIKVFDNPAFTATITVKSFKKKFYRVFRLNERTDKGEAILKIQSLCDEYLQSKLPTELVPLKDLNSLINSGIRLIITDYLMFQATEKLSADQDEIFFLLKTSEENLMVQADLDCYPLQLKSQPDEIEDFEEVPPYHAFEKHKPSKFIGESDFRSNFKTYDAFDNESKIGSLFKTTDRIRLIHSMISSNMNLGMLTNLGVLSNFLPLNDYEKLNDLKSTWGNFSVLYQNPFRTQNLPLIRDYFGEKIAMYFRWLEFLMRFISPIVIISLVCTVLYFINNNSYDDDEKFTSREAVIVIMAILLPIFSTFYEQMWLREQSLLAWRWGTTNLMQVEDQRPEFRGKYEVDKVTGKLKKVIRETESTRIKRIISISVICTFVGMVFAAIIGIFWYRSTLSQSSKIRYAIGVLNAIQIKIFNMIYVYIARFLNEWENYELPSQYTDGLAIKLFLFQFVNSYISLFYIAFFKRHIEGCTDDNCINELSIQLGAIFVTNLLLNFVEILTPMIFTKLRMMSESRQMQRRFGEERALSEEEYQAKKSNYDTPLSDYMEVIIAYGYVILFGASFPITPLLFLILIIVEIRVDAWKLCNLTQRPYPQKTDSIGVWLFIIQVMSVFGAITNVGIIIFTTNVFGISKTSYKLCIFIIIEHILLFFKAAISLIIPDVPDKVEKGVIWGRRVAAERLHGQLIDVEKASKARNLYFIRESSKKDD